MPLTKKGGGGSSKSSILGHVATVPPAGKHPVTNLYWDPTASKVTCEYDDLGVGAGNIVSSPPVDCFPIINIYFDPVTGTFQGEYNDDTSLDQEGGGHILLE